MSKYLIRTAQAHDISDLSDIYRRSSLFNDGDRPSLLANPDALVFPEGSVREQRTRAAVADGQIIGFATTQIAGDVAEVDDLFVDPDWMRRGVASALIDDVAAIARARGVSRVEVTANDHALGFYRAAGFVLDDTTETRFGPAVRMHLDVAP